MAEFQPFPKIPRLFRDMVVTEKLDGTNAAVVIVEQSVDAQRAMRGTGGYAVVQSGYYVCAQSRKRFIAPGQDNAGFAGFVWEHADELAEALGPGTHYGEWWGQGIGRKYGMDHKRFSLFNVKRWGQTDFPAFGLDTVDTVPMLATWTMDTATVEKQLALLREEGCQHPAALGFRPAEGVVVFHTAGGCLFKATIEGDDKGKEWGA